MSQVLEGTWEELARHAPELRGKRLRLVVLDEPAETVDAPEYLTFGMFPVERDLTDEDFKSAEFHGDPDDFLEWHCPTYSTRTPSCGFLPAVLGWEPMPGRYGRPQRPVGAARHCACRGMLTDRAWASVANYRRAFQLDR